ncbi:hypothetical protein BT93_L5238 [Corymbia citriodora subsp. variegata]|uniref:Rab-GAP TBC domain-containing protein n=1 Tax=Corymbia citriodora subsp. variegata TaxID=360336 RepID=A0A8T0CJZ8_CORYI|nr:hypothetical protein BT93_L5238 [Corymbia citriodora subsp. variegata]
MKQPKEETRRLEAVETVSAPGKNEKALSAIRREILGNGISSDDAQHTRQRSVIWKLLLGVYETPAKEYLDLVQFGSSVVNDKIRNDTFRTLATDVAFQKRVQEEMLVRLLDAFVWQTIYIQGMNVLAAPFLYAMPSELEAFYCFSRFLEVNCPLYVQQTLEGVHRGLKLLDMCMEVADAELYAYLKSKGLSAEVYAFPSILTFSAGTPPLDEVLHLWDFLLAFGVHLNVLCVVAQLHLIRDEILAEPSPIKMLRTLPPLNARSVIALCCQFVKDLPEGQYDKLVRHVAMGCNARSLR